MNMRNPRSSVHGVFRSRHARAAVSVLEIPQPVSQVTQKADKNNGANEMFTRIPNAHRGGITGGMLPLLAECLLEAR